MALLMEDYIKGRSVTTYRKTLGERIPGRSITTYRKTLGEIKGRSNTGRKLYNWFPYIKGRSKTRQSGYFDTIFGSSRSFVIPSRAELDSKTTVRVLVQFPDLGTEVQIPKQYIKSYGYDWKFNQEIMWNLTLIDMNQIFTDSNNATWKGVFNKGIYSYLLDIRKFLKFELCSWVGNKTSIFVLPRLVIGEVKQPEDHLLSITGVDEITETLTQEICLPSFCARETLGRVDDTHFLVSFLTHDDFFDVNRRSELYVNFERMERGFSYNPSTKIVTFDTAIDAKYTVMMINPISKKWALHNICKQCVDRFPEKITREYFDVRLNFKKDTYFYSELSTIDTTPLETINKIRKSIPADYLILPVGNKLSLVFQDKVLGDEYPSSGDYYIPETLFRGEPDIPLSSVSQYNKVDIKRYSAIFNSYQSVTVTE